MPPKPLRVGVVGWGLAGRVLHAPFIQSSADLVLAAAVTSRDVDAALYPAAKRFASLDDLLRDGAVDLVVVATPNRLHVEQCLRALDAGKHVVCDKPVAETAGEVRALAAAAARAGRLLVPFQNRRWDGDFLTVRALVAAGRLGRVHYFESAWSKYQPASRVRAAWKAEPGFNGPLYDLFPHLVDQALVLFGRPARVSARIEKNRAEGAVHDRVHMVLDYPAGPEVVLEVDLLDAFGGRRLLLRGARGCFAKSGFDPQEARLSAGGWPTAPGWGEDPPELFGELRAAGEPAEKIPTIAGDHGAFYSGVAAAILRGEAPPVSLEDVEAQLAIIEAALRSSDVRESVAL